MGPMTSQTQTQTQTDILALDAYKSGLLEPLLDTEIDKNWMTYGSNSMTKCWKLMARPCSELKSDDDRILKVDENANFQWLLD